MSVPGELPCLAALMQVRVRRDECGLPCIIGRRGNIHADDGGFSVYLDCQNVRRLNLSLTAVKRFGTIRQAGDTEIVFHVETARLSPEIARELRQLLRVRKLRDDSDTTKARLRATAFAPRHHCAGGAV